MNPQRTAEALKNLAEKKEYKPLTEIVEDVYAIEKDHLFTFIDPLQGHPLLARQELVMAVQQHLESHGVDKVAFLGLGSSALVLRLNDHEVCRLSTTKEKRRPKLPEFLQPTYRTEIGGLRLEVLPMVKTEGVTSDHNHALKTAMAEKGYLVDDSGPGNIGLLQDGTPVYIDADVAAPASGLALAASRVTDKIFDRFFGGGNTTPTVYDFSTAQAQHRAVHSLEEGKIGSSLLQTGMPENTPPPGSHQTWQERQKNDGPPFGRGT